MGYVNTRCVDHARCTLARRKKARTEALGVRVATVLVDYLPALDQRLHANVLPIELGVIVAAFYRALSIVSALLPERERSGARPSEAELRSALRVRLVVAHVGVAPFPERSIVDVLALSAGIILTGNKAVVRLVKMAIGVHIAVGDVAAGIVIENTVDDPATSGFRS